MNDLYCFTEHRYREVKGPHSPKMHCASEFRVTRTFKKLIKSVIIVFFHYRNEIRLNRILYIYFNPPVYIRSLFIILQFSCVIVYIFGVYLQTD